MGVVEDIILVASELRDAVVQDLSLLEAAVRQSDVLLAESAQCDVRSKL